MTQRQTRLALLWPPANSSESAKFSTETVLPAAAFRIQQPCSPVRGGPSISQATTSLCCPPFDPASWDDQELVWQDRRFLKGRIRSFLHIPLNFAAVLKRSAATLDAAGARPNRPLILVDENSLWGADLYMEASRDVPGVTLETLSGTFLTRVFEGPYRNIPQWVEQMKAHVQSRGRTLQKLWFHYPTCPRCARAFGKNHVVFLAQVEPVPAGSHRQG